MYFKTISEVLNYIESQPVLVSEQLMIMVADKSSWHLKELRDYLNYKNIKFFGGIYAGLLVGHKLKLEGFIILKIQPIYSCLVLPFMMRCNLDMQSLQ
ncbi:MAG: FIST domain-containing protein, partial [Clostridia bacterium]